MPLFSRERQDQAPRERLFSKGAEALSDRELVAILLRTGSSGEDVLQTADRLLERGLSDLARSAPQDIVRRKGVGPAKAASLVAAFEMGRRVGMGNEEKPQFDHPDSIFRYVRWRIPLDREELYAFYLDRRLRLLSEEVLSRGGKTWTHAAPSDVFGPALRREASAVVLVHNHPSGDPTPSKADVAVTRRLAQAGSLLGVDLLDHLIVGEGRYVSFRRQSLLWGGGKEPSHR